MKQIAELFCLGFSFGIVFALIPIRRLDLLTPFFRTNALVSLSLFAVFAWLHGAGDGYLYFWPGALLLLYALTVFWLPPLIAKLFLLVLSLALLIKIHFIFSSVNTAIYNDFIDFTSIAVGAMLVGLSLVAMNIGHSYLSTVKLPMRPLKVTTMILGILIGVRLLMVVFGVFQMGLSELSHYFSSLGIENFSITAIALSRFLFGIVGPAILVVMVWKTVEIESTQSATGILYALLTMLLIGEGCSLFLNLHTPIWF